MGIRTLLSWSSGKDSAWTLHTLRQQGVHDVVGLLTTVNSAYDRVAMHGTRASVLRAQAAAAGLPTHPQHELAKRQMSGFGALITFETGSLARANDVLKRVRVCTLGESLGGVETLISHPATMTHAALGEEGRRKIGLTDGMVRISVGIEDVDDLIADLEQALA